MARLPCRLNNRRENRNVMTQTPEQLTFDLPHRPAHGIEDFIVTRASQAAVAMVDLWPDWPSHALMLVGPEGCGKTHLAQVWRLRTGAPTHRAPDALEQDYIDGAATLPAVVEDLDKRVRDEQGLFHLLNVARETGRHVLLTARSRPGTWDVSLPDLRSRLRSFPVALIDPPDDTLLRAVLVKLFADRQLSVSPPAIEHLALHLDRDMAAVMRVVAEIDRLQLQKRRPVTRKLAGAALARLASQSPSGET